MGSYVLGIWLVWFCIFHYSYSHHHSCSEHVQKEEHIEYQLDRFKRLFAKIINLVMGLIGFSLYPDQLHYCNNRIGLPSNPFTKGRVRLPNRMNFRKNSKQPSTPPAFIFGKLCYNSFITDMVAYMRGGMMVR